jgi:hypothetical protein
MLFGELLPMTGERATDRGEAPAWADEIYSWLPVAAQLVVTGSIADLHLGRLIDETDRTLHSTVDVVTDRLRASGYTAVLRWNPVDGVSCAYEEFARHVREIAGPDVWEAREMTPADQLAELVLAVTNNDTARVALIVEDAPRLAANPSDPDLHRVYVTAQHQAGAAPRRKLSEDGRQGLRNVVVWLVEREADLPHWLVGASGVRLVSISGPGRRDRLEVCTATLQHLDGFDELGERREEVIQRFVAFTEGLSLAAVAAAGQVALDQEISADRVEEAVRFVRSANPKSPWNEPGLRAQIDKAATELGNTVLGQARAVRKVADVLARAAIGLSGAHSSSHPTRPQGVLFLAGPTGVGKTEVAKKVAEIVFGRAEALIRFDMSEFAAENSEARLLGAPPGYVGHHAGGELTNAVRRRPFCLLLFDEIEKAHPRILDKFLQILEDGRLTDSAGSTVHFTETIIVFTSNLGTSPVGHQSRTSAAFRTAGTAMRSRPTPLRPGADYDQVDEQVRSAIRTEFLRLGRPELLNRIGDNIVVFDFISAPVASEILRRNLDHVAERVAAQTRSVVTFADDVLRDLNAIVTHPDRLAFGGRAVGSVVESRVLNPLARHLLTIPAPVRLEVVRIWDDAEGAHLDINCQALA